MSLEATIKGKRYKLLRVKGGNGYMACKNLCALRDRKNDNCGLKDTGSMVSDACSCMSSNGHYAAYWKEIK
jgi:hypothetical protein